MLKRLGTTLRPLLGDERDMARPAKPKPADSALRESVLEEFKVLRQEIAARSAAQHQLVALNMTVLAAIGGFVIAQKANPLLILVIPILSPALGIFWHDHSRNIEKIGKYIMEEIKPLVSGTLGDARPLSYEERMREYERMKRPRFPLGFSLAVLFAGCPAGALAYAIVTVEPKRPLFWFLFGAGVVMTALYLRMLLEFVLSPHRGRKLDRDAERAWRLGHESLRALESGFGFHASESGTGLYNALFGRDSLWTLLLLLEAERLRSPEGFAGYVEERGARILSTLAALQGTRVDDEVEEQPGKIVHEYRETLDERLLAYEMPFANGRSYAGFDQTFLFVVAYASFVERFPANGAVAALWPSVESALAWIDEHADGDGDGLFEYRRRDPRNHVNQVWKDSFDSAVARSGFDLPAPPLAWIDVQAYAHRALTEAAVLYRKRGDAAEAARLEKRADDLRRLVNDSFWLDDVGCFAMALDGGKRPIAMVSSNAGHALWAGLVDGERGERLVERLMRPDMLSAFGLRSLSASDPFYAPFSFHRGNVWPFDNAVVALGLRATGRNDEARTLAERVTTTLVRLGSPFELYIALDGALFVTPEVGRRNALALRKSPPENRTQAFSAAALVYFASLLSQEPRRRWRRG